MSADKEKDRRTRMMPHQTIAAPSKKDGAGGKHTWGGTMDYGPSDIQTCAPLDPTVIPSKVTVAAPVSPTAGVVAVEGQTVPSMDADSFPSLVKLPPGAVMVKPPTQVVWGPGMNAPTPVKPDESTIRVGSSELFDSTHPRNQFARKPRTASGAADQPASSDAPAIDWSSSGTTGVAGAIIQQTTNPAHLSPYAQAAPQIPLTSLKEFQQTKSVQQYVHQQPQVSKHAGMGQPQMSRMPGKVLQKRAR